MKKTILLLIVVGFMALVAYNACIVTSRTPSKDVIGKVCGKWNTSYSNYIILVDYSKPSCEERFYIYDKSNDKVIYSGVCMHGCGKGNTSSKPKFSNTPGSNCSSLGYYKVTRLGKMKSLKRDCFRLKGLSETNSNAEMRGILIHSGILPTMLPFEIYGANFPLVRASEGCFTVSLFTMMKLKSIFTGKPMLMYAYY